MRDANPFRYSGYQYDWETGLYYLKARYYSPGLGRFLTMDPVIGVNRYMYADNNPVNMVDLSGNITQDEIKAYKEGRLSKEDYDILMNLTKAYYNAPDKQSRDAVMSIAEKFRKSNYKMIISFEFYSFELTVDQAYRKGLQYHIEGLVASAGLGAILGFVFAAAPLVGSALGFGADVASFDNSLENVTPGSYNVAIITVREKEKNINYIITKGPATSILIGLKIKNQHRR